MMKILRKELFELLDARWGVLLVFILPSLILLLVGGLRIHHDSLRMLVAGRDRVAGSARFEKIVDLLHEVADLDVSERRAFASDPLETIRAGDYDLLLNAEGEDPQSWLLYTAETNRARYARLQATVATIDRAIRDLAEGGDEEDVLSEAFTALAEAGPSRLIAYYPAVRDRVSDLVSRTMGLILCFLPFMLAAPGLIRERQANTLEVLLAAPRIGPGTIALGKTLHVMVVSYFNLLVMLLVTQTFHGLSAKSGLLRMVVFLLPALLSATALGLAASSLARSETQIVIGLALYFLAMTLFSGFLYPLDEAHWAIRAVAHLFPLTFVHRDLASWLIGAGPAPWAGPATLALWLQALVFAGLAAASIRTGLRRL